MSTNRNADAKRCWCSDASFIVEIEISMNLENATIELEFDLRRCNWV